MTVVIFHGDDMASRPQPSLLLISLSAGVPMMLCIASLHLAGLHSLSL